MPIINKRLFFVSALAFFSNVNSATLLATEAVTSEVNSATIKVEDCSSPLFERLLAVEKTAHRLPLRQAKGQLKTYVDYYEDICPWRREGDVNGDRLPDWVGIVGERGKYSLIAYVSSGITYKIHTLKNYDKFPKDTYVSLIKTDQAKKLTGKAQIPIAALYVIAENHIRGVSMAWYWNGKVLSELGGFLDDTSMPQTKKKESEKDYEGPGRK